MTLPERESIPGRRLPPLPDSAYGPDAVPLLCGPYVCDFPPAWMHPAGDRWRCPRCGTVYRLTRRKYQWPWRNWSAPHGHWVVQTRWSKALLWLVTRG